VEHPARVVGHVFQRRCDNLATMTLLRFFQKIAGLDSAHELPAKCFISHAYADADLLQSFREVLPRGVEPFIFPAINIPPDQRVSDDLVRAILDCPGLIFLTSPASASSFWVTFERDYALRAQKEVFAYDPLARRLSRYRERPRDMPIFTSYSRKDARSTVQIMDFMRSKRYFDVFMDMPGGAAGRSFEDVIGDAIASQLERGGYCVAFISNASLASEPVALELNKAAEHWPDRILPVLLEPVDMSKLAVPLERQARPIYLDGPEPGKLNWHRVDDLIVQIYRLVFEGSVKASDPATKT
jgi:hypothetical protein